MQINLIRFGVVYSLAVLLFLSGCSLSSDLEATINRDVETVVAALETSNLPSTPRSNNTVTIHDDIWLGESSVKMEKGDPIPACFETADGITLVGGLPLSLMEIAGQINNLTDIPVRIEDMLLYEMQDSSGEAASSEENSMRMGGSSGTTTSSTRMLVAYSGSLSGLLEQVSSRFSVWWKYKDGVISFYNLETRTFVIYALTGDYSISSNVGGDATSASSSSASSVLSTTNVSLWDELKDSLIQMLPENSRLSSSPTTGTITITASPFTILRVAKFIKKQNDMLSRQVAIGVKILQVTVDNTDNYGLDLSAVLSSGGIAHSLAGPYSNTADTTGKISMAILDASRSPLKKWNGTELFIDALSEQGLVSLMTNTAVTTLNNKIVPVQVATEQSYISTITSTTDADGDTSYAITPGTVISGINMQLMPRILKHGRVMLKFSLSLTDLLELETINLGSGGQVQLPTIGTRGFIQEVVLKSGSTLVLTGFEKTTSSVNKRGIGSPDFTLLGGHNNKLEERSVLVILLTPEVLMSPLSRDEIS